jgi:hypothetical protein
MVFLRKAEHYATKKFIEIGSHITSKEKQLLYYHCAKLLIKKQTFCIFYYVFICLNL